MPVTAFWLVDGVYVPLLVPSKTTTLRFIKTSWGAHYTFGGSLLGKDIHAELARTHRCSRHQRRRFIQPSHFLSIPESYLAVLASSYGINQQVAPSTALITRYMSDKPRK